MCRLFSKQDEHFGDFNFTRLYNKSSFIFTHSSYPTTKAVHISNTNRLLLILLIIDLIYCSSFFVDPASLLLVSFFSFFLLKIASKLLAYFPPPPHPDSAGLNAISVECNLESSDMYLVTRTAGCCLSLNNATTTTFCALNNFNLDVKPQKQNLVASDDISWD